jgi:hypothetical protein
LGIFFATGGAGKEEELLSSAAKTQAEATTNVTKSSENSRMRESTDFFIKNPSVIFRKAASFYNNYCRRMKAWGLRVVDQLEFLLGVERAIHLKLSGPLQ